MNLDPEVLITSMAFAMMKPGKREVPKIVARQNEWLINECRTRNVDNNQRIILSTTYGELKEEWVLIGWDNTRYLDISIEKKGEWEYEENHLAIANVPETIKIAHMQACKEGRLTTGQIADARIFGDRKIKLITQRSDGFTSYQAEGCWSDNAVENYPSRISEWINYLNDINY